MPTKTQILEIGSAVFGVLIVILILGLSYDTLQAATQKNSDIKNAFMRLNVGIEKSWRLDQINIILFSLPKDYFLVGFDLNTLSSGLYEKPTECALNACLVVCKSSTFKKSDNCKQPIRWKSFPYEDYGDIKIEFNKDNPIIYDSSSGIINLYVKRTENTLQILKETEDLKNQYLQEKNT